MDFSRRRFIGQFAGLALAIPMVARGADEKRTLTFAERPERESPDIEVESLPSPAGHFHHLTVPAGLLEDPPALGVFIQTSTDLHHSHTTYFTQLELIAIATGNPVAKFTTDLAHEFVVSLES